MHSRCHVSVVVCRCCRVCAVLFPCRAVPRRLMFACTRASWCCSSLYRAWAFLSCAACCACCLACAFSTMSIVLHISLSVTYVSSSACRLSLISSHRVFVARSTSLCSSVIALTVYVATCRAWCTSICLARVHSGRMPAIVARSASQSSSSTVFLSFVASIARIAHRICMRAGHIHLFIGVAAAGSATLGMCRSSAFSDLLMFCM